jgi:hypothetical protein
MGKEIKEGMRRIEGVGVGMRNWQEGVGVEGGRQKSRSG